MNQATFGIAITADDKTAKGAKSAEKRLGQIPKHIGGVSRRSMEQSEKTVSGSGRTMIRTFTNVERAASKAFGGSSITSGLTSRLGGITQAASAAGSGMGEAAAAGGALEGAIGAVGVAASATVGVLAAAAWAALKVSDNWSKGAAAIGRTAEILGIGTKAMQEFSLAAERVGVDRGTATGAVGGLSQALNDAKYGRNNDVLALLGKLGVRMQLNSDGTVNVEAMLPAIADAIGRQNSSGRRTAARILGIPQSALPAFSQGGKSLSSDMQDASRTGVVLTDGQIEKAKRYRRTDVLRDQMVEAGTNKLSEVAADVVHVAADPLVNGARSIMEGGRINQRAAEKMDRAAGRIEQAAGQLGGGGGGAIAGSAATIDAIRRAAAVTGVDPQLLLGIAAHESGLNPSIKAKTSSATGLFQFLSGTWMDMVGRHGGKFGLGWASDAIRGGRAGKGTAARAQILALRTDPYLNALMGGEMAKENAAALSPILGHKPTTGENYMANFLGIGGASKFFRAEQANPTAGAARLFPEAAAANRSVFYGGNGRERSLEEVANLMASFVERPIKVEIDMRGAPPGTKATVRSGHGPAPAISRAMQQVYSPVHGG